MSPYFWWRPPSVLTKRGRQLAMQDWRCCFCGQQHAFWFHDHPGRNKDGSAQPPEERQQK